MILEVCVDSPGGLMAAKSGGADRVELCSALALGGLTPTTTMMALAGTEDLPFVVMIRPREGDFVYTRDEVDHMQAEIDEALELGAGGIVLGALRPDGRLDIRTLKTLTKDLPDDIDLVLHRAVDLTPDPGDAVDQAIGLGFDRILTSGGAARAVDGLGRLRAMFDRAAGRITIMPGSGITSDTLPALLALLPVDELHASCAAPILQDPATAALGLCAATRRETRADLVRALRRAMGAG
jgi:copper homeostasis protein